MGKPIKKTDRKKVWFIRETQKVAYRNDGVNKTFLIICEGVNFSRKIYDRIENDERADITSAMKNSEKLFSKQAGLPFSDQNPCTTIYQLVCELSKYIDGFERPSICEKK